MTYATAASYSGTIHRSILKAYGLHRQHTLIAFSSKMFLSEQIHSSKEIEKVRRIAKRTRVAIACARCKSSKVKCSDFRPCKHCADTFTNCQDANESVQRISFMSANKKHYLSSQPDTKAASSFKADSSLLDSSSVLGSGAQRFLARKLQLTLMPTAPSIPMQRNPFAITHLSLNQPSSLPLFESSLPSITTLHGCAPHATSAAVQTNVRTTLTISDVASPLQAFAPLLPRFWIHDSCFLPDATDCSQR